MTISAIPEVTTRYNDDHSWRDGIREFARAIIANREIRHGSSLEALKTMRRCTTSTRPIERGRALADPGAGAREPGVGNVERLSDRPPEAADFADSYLGYLSQVARIDRGGGGAVRGRSSGPNRGRDRLLLRQRRLGRHG
jgi:hypothetical protein